MGLFIGVAMNIFEKIRFNEAMRRMKCDVNMLDVYSILKSLELAVTGKYDFNKYGTLQKLTEDSFNKETSDMKLAVRCLASNLIYSGQNLRYEALKICAVIAGLKYCSEAQNRLDIARAYVYRKNTPEMDMLFHYIENGFNIHLLNQVFIDESYGTEIVEGKFLTENPYFEFEVQCINNFHNTVKVALNQHDTILVDFFTSK